MSEPTKPIDNFSAGALTELLPRESQTDVLKVARSRIMRATSAVNADMLTDMRCIIRNQLKMLKSDSLTSTFTVGKAVLLEKLARAYAVLDSYTDKEIKNSNFAEADTAALEAIEAQAIAMLKDR